MNKLGTTLLLLAAPLSVARAQETSITAALASARAGDTLRIAPGVYHERLVVEVPVVLVGEGRPIIDGRGEGTVLELRAPTVVRGFRIRGSGRLLDQEDAGILVLADSCIIEDNELEDVLFGIYLKESDGSRVLRNRITGKDRPLGRRGDGIRLWSSNDALVEWNLVSRTRDVVIYFSHGLRFRNNRVSEGRYGLHYMYSSRNTFEHNEFTGNDVAAFIMYSSDIVLRENVFARASGHSGYGIGLKDADRIEVTNNLVVQNQVGIYLDNSPSRIDVRNRIAGNVLAFNDVAVDLLPSVRANDFADNIFSANVRDVSVSGGGTALANAWNGNSWDAAASWDADGDEVLDLPYRIERLSDDLFAKHAALRMFELSPAALALDAIGRFFPLLEPQPIVVDSFPQPLPTSLQRQSVGLHKEQQAPGREPHTPIIAALWLGLVAISVWGAWKWPL